MRWNRLQRLGEIVSDVDELLRLLKPRFFVGFISYFGEYRENITRTSWWFCTNACHEFLVWGCQQAFGEGFGSPWWTSIDASWILTGLNKKSKSFGLLSKIFGWEVQFWPRIIGSIQETCWEDFVEFRTSSNFWSCWKRNCLWFSRCMHRREYLQLLEGALSRKWCRELKVENMKQLKFLSKLWLQHEDEGIWFLPSNSMQRNIQIWYN